MSHEHKKLITRVRNALAWMLGAVLPCPKEAPESVRARLQAKAIRKLLFLRPQQGIGDLLLGTPVLRALKEAYPHLEIHFLATPHNVVAVQHNPHLAKVWVWRKRSLWNPWRLFSFWRDLRRERFELAIELVGNTPSFTSFLVARAVGARRLWSYDTSRYYGGTNWSKRLANTEIPAPPEDAIESLKFSALVAPLAPVQNPAPQFFPTAEDEAAIAALWPKLSGSAQKTVGIFLGGNAARMYRLWLPSAWVELTRLLQEAGLHVVAICPPKDLKASSGAPEANFYDGFRQALGKDVPVFDEKGFGKAAALIKRFDLFVCPDGGLFHVSCAVGTPTLGLFFGTDPIRWRPPVPWAETLAAPDGKPAQLTPQEVARKALQRLNTAARLPA